MWFRNLLVYTFPDAAKWSDEALQEALAQHPFRPCGHQDTQTLGWVSLLPGSGQLVHSAGDCALICLRRQQKILPAAAVREQLDERIAKIEQDEGRKVFRRERLQLREEITDTLLPRALTRSSRCHAYIDRRRGQLLIDSGNRNAAEELLNLLRECLGSLAVVPLNSAIAPGSAMTSWLHGNAPPEGFQLGRHCELKDPASPSNVIRARDQDLVGEELMRHLEAGKQVTKVNLSWRDAIEVGLGEDLSLKGLKFSDALREDADQGEDAAARLDQGFAVMSLELGHFVDALVEGLGGKE